MFSYLAELGDFNPDEHREGYLSEFRFIPNQDEEFEKEVAKHHQSHRWETDFEYRSPQVRAFMAEPLIY